MSYATVEVEIDRGRIVPRGPEKLPEKASGLLTILSPTGGRPAEAKPPRQRVELPLIRCQPGTVINPTREDSMPASGVIKLADANVWLAVAVDGHIHHARAKAWFNAQAEQSCALCRVTQMALLRHLTNSKIMGANVQTQAEAWRAHDKLANDPRVIFLDESTSLETVFRRFTQAASPAHGLWTDAYLAAFAGQSGAQFVTFDQGCSVFAGVDLLVLS